MRCTYCVSLWLGSRASAVLMPPRANRTQTLIGVNQRSVLTVRLATLGKSTFLEILLRRRVQCAQLRLVNEQSRCGGPCSQDCAKHRDVPHGASFGKDGKRG